MKTIRVVSKAPGQPAVDVQIDPDDVSTMQALVGGYLEGVGRFRVQSCPHAMLFANEEGKLQGLAPNISWPEGGEVIVGTVVVAKAHPPELVDMPEEEAALVRAELDARGVS